MRRLRVAIFAVAGVMMVLGAGLIVASFAHRGRSVLLQWHRADDAHDFLVVDEGSLIVARQKVEPIGTGLTPDASEFGKLRLIIRAVAAGQPISGSISVDPYARNDAHGFLWINFGPVTLGNGSMRVTCRAAGAPMWAIGIVAMLPGLIVLARIARSHTRRAERLRRGLCVYCGYDLRGSGDVCPECGRTRAGRDPQDGSRMTRRFVANFAIVVCTVLALAAAAVWMRSRTRTDSLYTERFGRGFLISSAGGYLGVISEPATYGRGTLFFGSYPTDKVGGGGRLRVMIKQPESYNRRVVVFGTQDLVLPNNRWTSRASPPTTLPVERRHWFAVQDSALVALFALPPLVRLLRRLRSLRRVQVGLCARCGYDLRASPERCPECGHVRDAPPAEAVTT